MINLGQFDILWSPCMGSLCVFSMAVHLKTECGRVLKYLEATFLICQ